MNFKILKSLLFTVLCGICAFGATAATPMFSDYGQIQNVQYYSTNPFWTPNSPYNKRMPQPVYVQGADLNTEDCMNVVQSLVYVQCLARDNCRDTSLSDIRPTIMVQLSNLPGNNYVSACAGYIDGIFDAFVKQFGNTDATKRTVTFPDATTPNPNIQNINTSPQLQNQNSYQPTNNKKIPDWQSAIKERTRELTELQNQNGADSYDLSATDFPATLADLSFKSQVALKTDGYEPFMGKSAYSLPMIKGQNEFCSKYPDDPRCPEIAVQQTEPSAAIGTRNEEGSHQDDEGSSYAHQDTEEDCTDAMKASATDEQKTLIKKAITIDGVCKITECNEKDGVEYVASEDGQTCITTVERPQPGTDCSAEISGTIPYATKITWNEEGKCVVSECEPTWHPNIDECESDTVIYTMSIRHGILSGLDDEADNLCYAVCGVHSRGDDLNEKVLHPILGKDYCVTDGSGERYFTESDDSSRELRFTEEQYRKILKGLNSIRDKGECDGFPTDIDIYIYKKNTTNDTEQQMDHIILDD